MSTENLPFSPLVGAVLTQMFTDSRHTTNTLLDNYRRQIADLTAELAAVRDGVARLLDGPYAPNTHAIERAVFFPPQDLIDFHREEPIS